MMQLGKMLLLVPALLVAALATPTDDMRKLQTASQNAASVVNSSLNSTAGAVSRVGDPGNPRHPPPAH